MEKYDFFKNGKPVEAQHLNSVLSSIYSPIVPVKNLSENDRHYMKKRLNEDYYVFEAENGSAIVKGNLSIGLLGKLNSHGIVRKN
jgi:hypothetical protein